MKNIYFSIVLLFIGFNALHAQNEEVAAIKEVIQEAYVDGFFNDGYLRSVELSFSEHFESIGLLENDQTKIETVEDWMAEVRRKKASGYYPAPPEDHVTVKYLHVEISRTVANVKLEFSVGGKPKYIDFLALYKFSGGWKIVNRTYHALEEKDRKPSR